MKMDDILKESLKKSEGMNIDVSKSVMKEIGIYNITRGEKKFSAVKYVLAPVILLLLAASLIISDMLFTGYRELLSLVNLDYLFVKTLFMSMFIIFILVVLVTMLSDVHARLRHRFIRTKLFFTM